MDRQKKDVALSLKFRSCPSAALADEVAHKPPVPLNARPDAVLGAHRQNGDRPPADAVVGVEHSLLELRERKRRLQPEALQDLALHDRPDLLDGREVRRIGRPVGEDADPVVAPPAHRVHGLVARRSVLLEK